MSRGSAAPLIDAADCAARLVAGLVPEFTASRSSGHPGALVMIPYYTFVMIPGWRAVRTWVVNGRLDSSVNKTKGQGIPAHDGSRQ